MTSITPSTRTYLLRIATLVLAAFVITFGCALCIRANLGTSPMTVLPYAWSLAGGTTIGPFHVPQLTIGVYTFILDVVLIMVQMCVLRRRYQSVQLLQLSVAALFALCLDLNMYLTSSLLWTNIVARAVQLFIGCTIMAFGLTLEVTARLVYKPGVGTVVAMVQTTGVKIGTIKMSLDCTLVLLAIVSVFVFFHSWQWHIVGVGTLFSMFYVGAMVNAFQPIVRKIKRFIYS